MFSVSGRIWKLWYTKDAFTHVLTFWDLKPDETTRRTCRRSRAKNHLPSKQRPVLHSSFQYTAQSVDTATVEHLIPSRIINDNSRSLSGSLKSTDKSHVFSATQWTGILKAQWAVLQLLKSFAAPAEVGTAMTLLSRTVGRFCMPLTRYVFSVNAGASRKKATWLTEVFVILNSMKLVVRVWRAADPRGWFPDMTAGQSRVKSYHYYI